MNKQARFDPAISQNEIHVINKIGLMNLAAVAGLS